MGSRGFIAALMAIVAVTAGAQTVQRLELELRLGLTMPLEPYHHSDYVIGPALAVEGRSNFPESAWDVGVTLWVTTAVHKFDQEWEQSNRSIAFAITGDYNFRKGSRISPFVGAVAGASFRDALNDVLYPSSGTSPIFAPRAGIEFWNRWRLTYTLGFTHRGFNNQELSIGFVFGGRPR